VVVSPFAAESWDAATDATRRAWPGVVQAVRVGAREDTGTAGGGSPMGAMRATTRADRELPPVDDPIGAAFALAVDSTLASIRVRRDGASAADSAWARQGGVLVWWPRAGAGDARAARGPKLVMLGDGIRSAAGHFVSLPGVALPGRAILRWGDGTIAAAEESLGSGCVRRVAVGVPEAGDEVLRPGFVRLVRGLAAPCGGGGPALVDDETIASWANAAPTSSESVSDATFGSGAGATEVTFAPPRPSPTLARWLLAAVALALLIEWWLRRQRAVEAARDESRAPASRVAA